MARSAKKRRRRRRSSGPAAPPRSASADGAPAAPGDAAAVPAKRARRGAARGARDAPASRVVPGAGTASLKARREEAPRAIWAPLPVTEGLILTGLILLIVGVVGTHGQVAAGGLVIVAAASIELAAREHFAGYRSHSSMLAMLAGVGVGLGVGFGLRAAGVGVPIWVVLVLAAVVIVVAFVLLRRVFRRRTGGLPFRV